MQEFTKYYAFDSGADYAMEAKFTTCNDKNRDAEAIAKLAVEAAAEFNDGTGLPLTADVSSCCAPKQAAARVHAHPPEILCMYMF